MSNNKDNNLIKNNFKSGFVSILGKTNVGKSSILNTLIGEKIAAITNKPQTTRTLVKGILNRKSSQIIFVDTPGIHKSHSKLGDTMISTAYSNLKDVDLILFVVDATNKKLSTADNLIIEEIKKTKKSCLLIINKIDLISKEHLAEIIDIYAKLYDFKSVIPISTLKKNNLDVLINEIESNLPIGPKYYSDEEYTDQTIRDLVEEIIREKALLYLKDEVPHGIFVEVSKLKNKKTRENEFFYDVDSTIYCLRESHKGIIIGKDGLMLKKIGTSARKTLEHMLDTKINLNIWVKVKKDWINDINFVNKFKPKN